MRYSLWIIQKIKFCSRDAQIRFGLFFFGETRQKISFQKPCDLTTQFNGKRFWCVRTFDTVLYCGWQHCLFDVLNLSHFDLSRNKITGTVSLRNNFPSKLLKKIVKMNKILNNCLRSRLSSNGNAFFSTLGRNLSYTSDLSLAVLYPQSKQTIFTPPPPVMLLNC